jgi:Tfp pilus assembly protein PilO
MAEGFNFNEWLAKAKEDPKVAAQPVVILVALILLAFRFGYSPQKVLLAKELKKHKGILRDIAGYKSAVENIEEIKLEVTDLQKNWAIVEEKCYPKQNAPLFIQDIRNIARQADLNFRSITPLPPQVKKFETLEYEIYSVKVSFQGDLKQLGKLLRLMEKHKKLIYVELPNLQPDASGTFRFDLIPTTILIEAKRPVTAATGEGL